MKSIFLLTFSLFVAGGAFADSARATATLEVSNMDCAVCPITVRKALEKVPGVATASVDFKAKRAVVAFDPAKTTTEALAKATADAGFPSSVEQVR